MSKETTLWLPTGGKAYWTALMQGEAGVATDILENQPIVMATAQFSNGITVVGGVYKSSEPTFYNIKFYYVFDANGNLLPDLIDPSDNEDFLEDSRVFDWHHEGKAVEYLVHVKEKL
ncbi:MAG: hypothetical protein AB8G22_02610 [Saprospiraceae bacterium]